ncbi:MAG: hypothetical protein AB1717_04165 [Pseudomonadota bacterium]
MNDKTNVLDEELLSALLDGDLSRDEMHRLREQTRDRGAQHVAARKLERYAMLGEMLRAGEDSPLLMSGARRETRDVVGAVMQQIASETARDLPEARPSAPKSAWRPGGAVEGLGGLLLGWRAPALSMALAAGVAVVMLVMQPSAFVDRDATALSAQNGSNMAQGRQAVVQSAPIPALAVSAPAGSAGLAELEAEADAMPDPYLLQHLTHADGGPMRTLSSNVRLASYERP